LTASGLTPVTVTGPILAAMVSVPVVPVSSVREGRIPALALVITEIGRVRTDCDSSSLFDPHGHVGIGESIGDGERSQKSHGS
jgi:hypothetical protein